MARRVFFSFHYQNDVWRASIVRNSHIVEGTAAAGFQDASLWEEAKKKGDTAIQRMIDAALMNTTVTAVLIGAETAYREWVDYEIKKSIERGNGLLGIYIDQIKDRHGMVSLRGPVPTPLVHARAPVYVWDSSKFGDWVETVAKNAGR
ncbi:TIR domain-containing protein [Myxococcus xanthus]|uniref:TIR domain-containing protein n=1 Tax=Myxococcus xanthus TaxID=34 RepID=UPI0011262747|nr:TIR domain-containing protein [Myxococcus xanthus]QDE84706.1 hypothetical protein BHS07_25890 [Myxococcus xanthus]